MEKKAKLTAMLQGKNLEYISNLRWYDYRQIFYCNHFFISNFYCIDDNVLSNQLSKLRDYKTLDYNDTCISREQVLKPRGELEGLDCAGFSEFLIGEGFHDDVVAAFSSNRICGHTFVQLTEDDLKELLPVIGNRVRIRKLLNELHQVISHILKLGYSRSIINLVFQPRIREEHSDQSGSSRADEVISVNTDLSVCQDTYFNFQNTTDVNDSENLQDGVLDSSSVSDPQWHLSFKIPELKTFSSFVRDAVKTGVVSARARCEIVQVLRTYVTAHTIKPTSEQYTTVCRRLIAKYPNLEDTEGKSRIVSYLIIWGVYNFLFQGSWKLSLRNAFKNFRKHYKATKEDDDDEVHTAGEPHAKRLRFCTGDKPPIDDEEYEEAIEKLQEDYRNHKKGMYVKNLMEITRIRRHQ